MECQSYYGLYLAAVVFSLILVTDYSADDVLASSLSFKAVPMTETGILVGLLLYTRLDNNKFFINIGLCYSKFSHFVAFTPRLNGPLLPGWFYKR